MKYTVILDNYEESGKWDFHVIAETVTEAIDKAKTPVHGPVATNHTATCTH